MHVCGIVCEAFPSAPTPVVIATITALNLQNTPLTLNHNMKQQALRFTLTLLFGYAQAAHLSAGEGMWVPQQLPQIASALTGAGLQLDPQQLADLTGAPLGAVVSLGGCTASFVSAQGLVATNHHCAYGAIQLNSTPERNLMQGGFYADTAEHEISAGPASRMYVLDWIEDVTDEVHAALDPVEDPLARTRALDAVEKTLIARCEATPGYRCRLYSFLGGNQYRVFRHLEIRDVRLVYAPPGGVGSFGGDVDNWMWPRHTGDFSFYRAYVGPDGQPADFAPDNIPYSPRHWLQLADAPLATGDFVMAAGYPGHTSRYALADEFEDTERWTYPTIIHHYRALIEMVKARGEEDAEIEVRYASMVRGWENTLKNYQGQLQGFARTDAAAHKRAEEAAVLEWLRGQGEAGQAALEAHQQLVAINEDVRNRRARDLVLAQFNATALMSTAIRLYRLSIEREKSDAERAQGYQERDLPMIEAALKQMERRYVPAMDRQLQRYWLGEYLKLPRAQRLGALDQWLGGHDQAGIERTLERLAGSALTAPEARMRWLTANRREFEASHDPAIRYAVALLPSIIERETQGKTSAGRSLPVRPRYLQAVADYRKTLGQAVYPDANGSLRITFGQVRGYTDLNGIEHRPFTTIDQIPLKATGIEPFNAPEALLDAVKARRFGGLADHMLDTVPVNFLSDLDVTGGNSGSPVLNAKGQLAGLLFDMNWESVSSNWVFDAQMTRTISVDQRYLRWIMQEVFPAPRVLEELGVLPAG